MATLAAGLVAALVAVLVVMLVVVAERGTPSLSTAGDLRENDRVTVPNPAPSDTPVSDSSVSESSVADTSVRLDPAVAARLKRDSAGLVAAVVQEYDTGQVLMLGWMDDEALRRTLTSGRATYWSRSRREYWRKGDTSGNVQHVRSVALDCDGDALLVTVDQVGPACHTGRHSCFDADVLLAETGDNAS